jgi:oxamate amidohydrolase
MGGEGQPQTQAAVFTRHVRFGRPLQEAITAPRWLLGRTWGDVDASLKIENRFASEVVDPLRAAGHEVEIISPFSDLCGHAGTAWPIPMVFARARPTRAPTAPHPEGKDQMAT